jgi:hypothetical protein
MHETLYHALSNLGILRTVSIRTYIISRVHVRDAGSRPLAETDRNARKGGRHLSVRYLRTPYSTKLTECGTY